MPLSFFQILKLTQGDTHGQFYDLLTIFSMNGYPSDDHPYVINGDWVDRGRYGTAVRIHFPLVYFFEMFLFQITLVLLAFKIVYPNSVHLIRGNHESYRTTQQYGFRDEVLALYHDESVYQKIMYVFKTLPICAVINGTYFVVV